jgi:PAS domain S-box-containing protein
VGIGDLFDPSGFPPRWACGQWSALLGWTHIIADTATWAAYTAIPLVLVYFIRRRTLPVPRIIWLFAAFILACGLTHLTEAVIFWYPVYRLSAALKVVTALVSCATVLALVRITPEVMRLPAFGDLTLELQRARARAEAEARHLAALVEHSSDAIFGLDLGGRVRSRNPAATAVLGHEPGETLERPFESLVAEDDAAAARAAIDEALESGESGALTVTVRDAAGGLRELELTVAPVGESLGNPIAVAVVGRDVTERNRAREELEEANRLLEGAKRDLEARVEERTEALLHANEILQHEVRERRAREAELEASQAQLEEAHRIARLGTWRWHVDEDRVEWSRTLYELFGLDADAELGPVETHMASTYQPADEERLAAAVARAVERGEPYELELETRFDPPAPRWLVARGQPRVDETGRVVRLEGTALDVTRLKEQEKALAAANAELEAAVASATGELRETVSQLEVANQDLESFVHMASHDMQEPLRTLRNYSSLLVEDIEEELSPDARDDLRFIEEAAGRMQRMLGALLELSHTWRRTAERVPVDVDALVRGVLEDYEESKEASQASVRIEALPSVVSDPRLLERIFSNLVSNAFKFGGDPPEVRVFGREDASAWVFGVEDGGEGMDEGLVERAFQPFKRLPSRRKVPGTGMGLTICRKAVERLGGRIWVERGASGGAVFLFSVPREVSS